MAYQLTKEAIKEVLQELIGQELINTLTEIQLITSLSRHPTGKPFYVESCEYARAWAWAQSNGGTGSYKVDTGMGIRELTQQGPPYSTPYNGKSSFLIRSSGVNNGYLNLNHIMSIPSNLRLGFEIFFAFPYTSGGLQARCRLFTVGFELRDADGIYHEAKFRFRPSSQDVVLYRAPGPAEPTVLDLSANKMYGAAWNVWQNAKLIVDFSTDRYVKLYWNEDEVDLSAYSIYTVSTGEAPRLSNLIQIHDLSPANQFYTFIGGVILTLEEP